MAVNTPAPSPVSLSHEQAPRWSNRDANVLASLSIWLIKVIKVPQLIMVFGVLLYWNGCHRFVRQIQLRRLLSLGQDRKVRRFQSVVSTYSFQIPQIPYQAYKQSMVKNRWVKRPKTPWANLRSHFIGENNSQSHGELSSHKRTTRKIFTFFLVVRGDKPGNEVIQ